MPTSIRHSLTTRCQALRALIRDLTRAGTVPRPRGAEPATVEELAAEATRLCGGSGPTPDAQDGSACSLSKVAQRYLN
ncbi:hypothetical protein ACIGXM_29750 [Kitasatospora sp. NPDC052896]|uniref:hypothetical protein n=1 Tax=Kitasatospora sp. NPDC052896 TaxID=3364061 RepID=UPI0037C5CE49